MKFELNGKTYETEPLQKIMWYINELVRTTNLNGEFCSINLKNGELANKYSYIKDSTKSSDKYKSQFSNCIDTMCELGIIEITQESNKNENKARLFAINKIKYLIFLSLTYLPYFLTKKEKRELKQHTIKWIIETIYSYITSDISLENVFRKKVADYIRLISNYLITTTNINFYNIYPYNTFTTYFNCSDIFTTHCEYLHNNSAIDKYITNTLNTAILNNTPGCRELSYHWFVNDSLVTINNEDKTIHYGSDILTETLINKLLFNCKLSKFTISKKVIKNVSINEIEKLANDILKQNRFVTFIYNAVSQLSKCEEGYHISIAVNVVEHKNNFSISIGGRMSNSLCAYHKRPEKSENDIEYIFNEKHKYRNDYLYELGINLEYDIKGAIFLLACRLNDIDIDISTFDIKQEFANLKIIKRDPKTKVPIGLMKRDDFKFIGVRLFFEKSFEESYSHYKGRYITLKKSLKDKSKEEIEKEIKKLDEEVPTISKNDYKRLYDYCQNRIGGSLKYVNNIFIIESAVEALWLKKIQDSGFIVKNVYDCVFWKQRGTKEEDEMFVVQMLKESIDEVVRNYKQLSVEMEKSKMWYQTHNYKEFVLF